MAVGVVVIGFPVGDAYEDYGDNVGGEIAERVQAVGDEHRAVSPVSGRYLEKHQDSVDIESYPCHAPSCVYCGVGHQSPRA